MYAYRATPIGWKVVHGVSSWRRLRVLIRSDAINMHRTVVMAGTAPLNMHIVASTCEVHGRTVFSYRTGRNDVSPFMGRFVLQRAVASLPPI
jgi:hypothetical protein